MFTTPRLVAIALCAALNFAIGNIVYLVKLPIYLDSIGTILCALLIFPDRLAAIACAFIAGFIGGDPHRPHAQSVPALVHSDGSVDRARLRAAHRARDRNIPGAPALRPALPRHGHRVRPRHRHCVGHRLGAGRGLSVRRRHRQRQRVRGRVLPQDRPAAARIRRCSPDSRPIRSTRPCRCCSPPCSTARRRANSSPCWRRQEPRRHDTERRGCLRPPDHRQRASRARPRRASRHPRCNGLLRARQPTAGVERAWVVRGIVLPLALFMMVVWVGIVGRAPHEIAANAEGSRGAALLHVAIVCLRLFIIAFTVQATFLHFAGWTPLRFVGALALPRVAKKLLVLTLSLMDTILQAVDRARTALIGAGIITRERSWRNLRHGWILVQTVWLTVVTIVIGRTRDKWPIEDTLGAARRLACGAGDGAIDRGRFRLDRARACGRRRGVALNGADRGREFLRPQRSSDGAACARRARRSSSGPMRRPRFRGSPARLRTRSRSIGHRPLRARHSSPSMSRAMRNASRRRCQAASRCCSRCIAFRSPTTRRSGSTPRWSSSILTIAIMRSVIWRKEPHRASARVWSTIGSILRE